MPRPTHIAETALYVDDLDRAQQFYTQLFDCAVQLQDTRIRVLRVADEQVLLLFLRGGSTQPTPLVGGTVPAHDGAGPLHVCFGIRAEDLAAWHDKLAALHIPVESEVRWPAGAWSLYFRDPDSHSVELATPGLWGG